MKAVHEFISMQSFLNPIVLFHDLFSSFFQGGKKHRVSKLLREYEILLY